MLVVTRDNVAADGDNHGIGGMPGLWRRKLFEVSQSRMC